jgi:hypothetical protein
VDDLEKATALDDNLDDNDSPTPNSYLSKWHWYIINKDDSFHSLGTVCLLSMSMTLDNVTLQGC